jgi:chemotaxis protein methyltransferase CheR
VIEEKLPTEVFDAISQIAYQQAGIVIGPKRRALVAARLSKRMRILGLQRYRDYLNHLWGQSGATVGGVLDPKGELVALLDVMTTNFTHFWREPDHFKFLLQELRLRLSQGQSELTLWCAAASTGEEPYTLAMIVLEAMRLENIPHCKVRILATDLSTRVLQTCLRGVYSAEALKALDPDWVKRYWVSRSGHKIRDRGFEEEGMIPKPELKKIVSFARMNLMETPYPMHGPFDVVFCRNVMIYFDQMGRQKVVSEIRRLLRPGGVLCVGHSESLMGMQDGFRMISPACYRRIPG